MLKATPLCGPSVNVSTKNKTTLAKTKSIVITIQLSRKFTLDKEGIRTREWELKSTQGLNFHIIIESSNKTKGPHARAWATCSGSRGTAIWKRFPFMEIDCFFRKKKKKKFSETVDSFRFFTILYRCFQERPETPFEFYIKMRKVYNYKYSPKSTSSRYLLAYDSPLSRSPAIIFKILFIFKLSHCELIYSCSFLCENSSWVLALVPFDPFVFPRLLT